MRPTSTKFPTAPLLTTVRLMYELAPRQNMRIDDKQDSLLNIARLLGTQQRDLHRWTREGIPERTAEKLAIRIGLYPTMVWAEWDIDHEHRGVQFLQRERAACRRRLQEFEAKRDAAHAAGDLEQAEHFAKWARISHLFLVDILEEIREATA